MPSDEYLETACEIMHDAYEAAAVKANWSTQLASRKPWSDVPDANKATMRAAVQALFDWQAESLLELRDIEDDELVPVRKWADGNIGIGPEALSVIQEPERPVGYYPGPYVDPLVEQIRAMEPGDKFFIGGYEVTVTGKTVKGTDEPSFRIVNDPGDLPIVAG